MRIIIEFTDGRTIVLSEDEIPIIILLVAVVCSTALLVIARVVTG